MATRGSVGGLSLTIVALGNTKIDARRATLEALGAMGKTLLSSVRKRTTLKDHTLKDLAAKDHPYARRHGSIRIHRRMPWQVHSQSGRMASALSGQLKPGSGRAGGGTSYSVGWDTQRAPEAVSVVLGTRHMLPRDPLWQVALDPEVQKAMMVAAIKRLGKVLRSQAVVRFTGRVPVGGGTRMG